MSCGGSVSALSYMKTSCALAQGLSMPSTGVPKSVVMAASSATSA